MEKANWFTVMEDTRENILSKSMGKGSMNGRMDPNIKDSGVKTRSMALALINGQMAGSIKDNGGITLWME